MASLIHQYNIGKNRLNRAFRDGFELSPRGTLRTEAEAGRHVMILGHIDSAVPDCEWGRLSFQISMKSEMVLIVRALASNDLDFPMEGVRSSRDTYLRDRKVSVMEKERHFAASGSSKFLGSRDVLLYAQRGRYLWIWIELLGEGEAELTELRVYTPGDNFFGTFPEVYHTDGEFFRRYLSIFSTLYSDLQRTVDSLHNYLDVDTAPAALLPVIASWLGLELDGNFLEEESLRRLLKAAFPLIQVKGTRRAVEGIIGVFLDEPVYIVEQHLLEEEQSAEDRQVYERLYGDNPYGFTVLLNRPADEKLHARLQFLINQFKPVRSKVNIVFLGDGGSMDSFCYLDINARLRQTGSGRLDGGVGMNGLVYLQ
jgi:phage tail-like protein